jgi:hydrogenase nickel incorporation protein HypA/HybF
MHEYSLTKQIVRIINRTALDNGAKKVSSVRLTVGENTGIIPDSVQMYFDMIAQGTHAEGAQLLVKYIKAEMHCPNCGKNFVRPRFSFECPDCGTLGNPTETGNEFYVESVELDI